ncbi:1-hydroxycarotenoid 3,4-desaturase CrtD [Limnohabitans sp.]|jgi:1-hydroxycarotenoid 3,4-desaturase|uniref:1-hydroxycarotenoid 3,4-desaturase CrtD n=1 Tax=Limnohabitans sp. TaxID=1907725 RepID=UPI0037C09B50
MSEHKVVIVGAGMGGLSSAMLLAHQGLDVTVVEAAGAPGGKVHSREVAGVQIDSGPTVFTMRWVFDALLQSVGTSVEAEMQISPLNVLARHFWPDGSQLDLSADAQESESAIAAWSGGDEARRFREFCKTTRQLYATLEGPMIRAQRPNMGGFMADLGMDGLGVLARLGPMRSLWQQLGHQFTDPRLRQLFARYATYCGSSPWQSPATLMLIAQVEMDGVWSVEGGMVGMAQSLARVARRHGAVFRYHSTARCIEKRQGRVCGVQLQSGEFLPAEHVIFNGDAAALRQGLLGDAARAAMPKATPPRSLSALTWSMHTPTEGVALDRHNVFFQNTYASEFEDIFDRQRLPQQPTVYVCAQDQPAGVSPGMAERIFCLVNAPACGDGTGITEEALQQCQTHTFNHLRQLGLHLQPTTNQCIRTTPQDFHQRFPASGGALYGQATHGWTSIFSRPGSTTPLQGLYLAGGSVHPGPGVPMAALSGQRAAEAVMASLVSTSTFPMGATFGGMSTP